MIKNYFKIAVRNLSRNKGFTLINIGGLAVGIACCLLIFAFVKDELSYDRFHQNAEQIYRVTYSTSDDGIPTNANGSFAVGPAMRKDFPEVREFTRLRKVGQIGTKSLVRYEENSFYEERFFFGDSTIFDVFSFPLLQGNPETALDRPNTVVITEETATKYFSGEDPIGKVILADPFGDGEMIELEITGVAQNITKNSHFQFDFLASLYSTEDNLEQFAGFQSVYTYLLLQEGTSEEMLEAKLLDFIHRNWTDDPWYTIQLQPMLDIHLYSQLRSEIQANGNIQYVRIFAIVAIFILIIACINFINLMTARSLKRAKEVGVRKAAGAEKNQLVRQFLTESILLSLVAGLIALVLVDLFIPVFNNITGKELEVMIFFQPVLLLSFIGVIFVVGVLAGFYPSLMLSKYKPVQALKGNMVSSSSGLFLRKSMVVFQFAISMALIASTGIVYKQLNYIQDKDLGYAEDQIMVLPLTDELRNRYDAFRSELMQYSGILNTTTSSLVPTMGSTHNRYQVEGVDKSPSFSTYFIDEHFVETYGLKVLAGSAARRDVLGEGGGDFMFSELAVNELGFNNPEEVLGRSIGYSDITGQATGVVNDIHVYSFRENVYASGYLVTPIQNHKYASIRLNSGNISESINHIQEIWGQMFPGYPFEYFFLDESFEQMHLSDTRMAEAITWFALLAILVACLGLFGLSAYAAEQRVKEVGIRKVLGASVTGIVGLFSKDYLKLVLLGAIIAIPVAWYAANSWLQEFAYRTDIGAGVFILAGVVLLVIAFSTISYHSVKAGFKNPIESLRSE